MTLRAVLFDLDGTVVDAPCDWAEIRNRLGIPGGPILSYLNELQEPERTRQMALLGKFEEEATKQARLKRGMREFLLFLGRRGLKTALVTNNSRENVDFLLQKFHLSFDEVLTRESGLWKPSGAPLKEVMRKLRVGPSECALVGNSLFDVTAGREAGIKEIIILWPRGKKPRPGGAKIFFSVYALQQRFVELLQEGPGQVALPPRQRKRPTRVLRKGAEKAMEA